MNADERATNGQDEAEADEAAARPTEDPNESTAGLLDEQQLREHAGEVDAAIQEAKNRNP